MNKSKHDLKIAAESNEFLATLCAWVVVIGVALEFVFAGWFEGPPETPFNHWGPACSDALVAAGVAGEVLFGRKARLASEELTRRSEARLAEANERAAKAELQAAEARERTAEIEKLTAWRRLSSEQQRVIADALTARASSIVAGVEYQTGDPESHTLARDILYAIRASGVRDVHFISNFHLHATIFQTFVLMPSENKDTAILAAFKSVGIDELHGSGFAFRKNPSGAQQNLYVWVGPKTPPAPGVGAAECREASGRQPSTDYCS